MERIEAMTDHNRRKELRTQARENPPAAGVYRIVNTATGKAFLGSALNLPSVESKLAFGKKINHAGVLDRTLHADVAQYGIEAFTFEILEVLDVTPGSTPAAIRADLAVLEALWSEKLSGDMLY
jgi:hypothetical protein